MANKKDKNKTPLERMADRQKRIEAILFVLAAALVISFSVVVYGIAQNQKAIDTGKRAICTQKHQAEKGVKTAKKFLLDHPNGTADFSRAFIENAIRQSQQQIDAYKDINCS